MGKVKIDMAQYAMLGHKEHQTILQMPFTAGKSFTQALPFGQLRLKISAHMVKVSCCFAAAQIQAICSVCTSCMLSCVLIAAAAAAVDVAAAQAHFCMHC